MRDSDLNQANLRETAECPCYRLVHPLRPGDLLPDHICRLTMQHSCHEYLIQNHGALAHSARIPIRFDPGGFGMIELETADEWPWSSVGGTKSVLMVLQQIVEHKASSKTPALLRNHEQWPQAKRALHAILRMVEMACVVKQWQVQNPQSSEIPASLVESLQPPPLYVPDISLEEEEEWNQDESPEDAGPGPLPAFLPLLQETDPELVWPALPPLSGPLGLSKDGLREAARQTLRNFNLSDSIGAADLLLSEVLPAALSPPSAPSALPDSLCVTSFLLGDTTLVIAASIRAQEEYNILVETAIDSARGAARRRARESHSSAPLRHGGETIFQITGSSDWAKTHAIKEAVKTVNAHKRWWAKQATRTCSTTDKRKAKGSGRPDPDQDDIVEETRDVLAHLSETLSREELRQNAYQRAKGEDDEPLDPLKKAEINRSLAGKVRYRKGRRTNS